MLNRVTILGRLVDTPTLRETQTSGAPVSNFSLAVERDYINQATGQRDVDFFNVTAWRRLAEFVSEHFQKGDKAIVDGRLELSPWVLPDRSTRQDVIIVAENIYFGGSKRTVAPAAAEGQGAKPDGEKAPDIPDAGLPAGKEDTGSNAPTSEEEEKGRKKKS